MYTLLKNSIKSLLPHRILIKLEPVLRACIYPFYKGSNFQCRCCGASLRRFIPLKNDLLCPKCGSIGRDRRLIQLLEEQFDLLTKKQSILDFSPSRAVYRFMKKHAVDGYRGTDLSGDFIADHSYDITRMDCADHQFDLIICYHVLEHVPDDLQAMKELKRVLRPGGTCFIQTPFHEGEIYEDPTITTPADRRLHFGQEDHVRVYSVEGLAERLKSVGFSVKINEFNHPPHSEGLLSGEVILWCC